MLRFLTGLDARWLMAGAGLVVFVGLLMMVRHDGYKAGVAHERKTWQPVLASYRTCQANTATLKAALDRQEAAVDRLAADGDERARRAVEAVQQAHKATESYRRERDRILAAKPGDDQCEAAENLIRLTLTERRK